MIGSSHLNIPMTTVVVFTVVASPLVRPATLVFLRFYFPVILLPTTYTLTGNSHKATVNVNLPVGGFRFLIHQIFASVASWHLFTLFFSNGSIWWSTTTTTTTNNNLRSQASLHRSCQIKPVQSIQPDKNRYFEVIPERPSTPSPLQLEPAVIFPPVGRPGSEISICVGVCTP